MPRQALAQLGVRQTAIERAHVLRHMRGLRSCGNGTRHGRMRHHELEEELRPVLAIELARPSRHRLALYHRKQVAAIERPVDDDRDLAFRGEWQQPFLDAAVGQVVGELHEVKLLPGQCFGHVGVEPAVRGGDADVAHLAGGLELLERFQVRLPLQHVVNLHEVELRYTPELARRLQLPCARRLAVRPDLGGREQPRAVRRLRQQIADNCFRGAVHRRRID